MKRIVKNYISQIPTADCLNQEFRYRFSNNEDEDIEIVFNNQSSYSGESAPISVNSVLEMLSNVNQEFMEIVYHQDHDNYIFNFFDAKVETIEQSKSIRNKEKIALRLKKAATERRLDVINKQIKQLENEK